MIEHAHPRATTSSRRGVARDTLIILNSALIAVAIAQIASGGTLFGPGPSQSPSFSEVVVGVDSLPPGVTLPPIPTLGQVVNGSAGLDASPTPIPIITLGPPTPSPSAGPSGGPSAKPSPKPTPHPTPTPTPKPPNAAFTCTVTVLLLDCQQTSKVGTTSWDWDWGDGAHSTGSAPATDLSSASHTYLNDGCYTVTLTATGPGGHDIVSHSYPVGATGTC